MSRLNGSAFNTTLTADELRLLALYGWAPGHYLRSCTDCTPERNARHARGEFGTAAPTATRCREHALEAALHTALAHRCPEAVT